MLVIADINFLNISHWTVVSYTPLSKDQSSMANAALILWKSSNGNDPIGGFILGMSRRKAKI
jgi:hypothetical protein